MFRPTPTRLSIFPLALCVLALAPAAAPASSEVSGDFNGDGHDDLAVGIGGEDVGTVGGAGAVQVIYGSPELLAAPGDQFWHQNSEGIGGASEPNDFFGSTLAPGDFQGDGFDDLAVGTPGENSASIGDVGAVNVIYGSEGGLTSTGNQVFMQGSGVADVPEQGDSFGEALTAGNFNSGGPDDLAIGVRLEDVGSEDNAGAVNVLYGNSATGLSTANDQLWHQDSPGVADQVEPADQFGSALAAGDFDGSGHQDLAVGVDLEESGSGNRAGAVNVISGSAVGLNGSLENQLWHQDSPGIAGAANGVNGFGSSLASGDFNGNGQDDLAIGVPFQTFGATLRAGAVQAIYGSSTGLSADGDQLWHQNVAGIAESIASEDRFGTAVTAGDFDGSGQDDIAVGVPHERLGSVDFAGALNVIYGSASRLSATGSQIWHQDIQGIVERADFNDVFGSAVVAADFDGSGHDDLAVGVFREDVSTLQDSGAVHAVYGSGLGLRASDNRLWHQDVAGIEDQSEVNDVFGLDLPN